jgi:hypothetical protein
MLQKQKRGEVKAINLNLTLKIAGELSSSQILLSTEFIR